MIENWDKEKIMIAELKTDVNYIREDINLMQKQILTKLSMATLILR